MKRHLKPELGLLGDDESEANAEAVKAELRNIKIIRNFATTGTAAGIDQSFMVPSHAKLSSETSTPITLRFGSTYHLTGSHCTPPFPFATLPRSPLTDASVCA